MSQYIILNPTDCVKTVRLESVRIQDGYDPEVAVILEAMGACAEG